MDGFAALYIFMLAAIAGHVIISRVPVILHTPLMSGSNFIHGIVLVGGMVVLGMDGRWGAMVILAVVGFLAGSSDNIARMVVFKKVSNIHPLATLVGAFAGLKYFGLLGVLLGPLAIAYFFELLKMYRREYLGGDPRELVIAE